MGGVPLFEPFNGFCYGSDCVMDFLRVIWPGGLIRACRKCSPSIRARIERLGGHARTVSVNVASPLWPPTIELNAVYSHLSGDELQENSNA